MLFKQAQCRTHSLSFLIHTWSQESLSALFFSWLWAWHKWADNAPSDLHYFQQMNVSHISSLLPSPPLKNKSIPLGAHNHFVKRKVAYSWGEKDVMKTCLLQMYNLNLGYIITILRIITAGHSKFGMDIKQVKGLHTDHPILAISTPLPSFYLF